VRGEKMKLYCDLETSAGLSSVKKGRRGEEKKR
jgi:hypothetical protein